jgi:hypothetical protein
VGVGGVTAARMGLGVERSGLCREREGGGCRIKGRAGMERRGVSREINTMVQR